MLSLDLIVGAPSRPDDFVAALARYAEASPAANHPLLDAIAGGDLTDPRAAIRTFLGEYYAYSRSFTRHLSAVSACLEDPAHRAALVPNACEESGAIDDGHVAELERAGLAREDVAAPHPELFRRFLVAIGAEADVTTSRPHVATTAWIESFHAVCKADEAQGVGALGIATEGIVRGMYGKILRGIRRAWPELAARDLAFFTLHALVDDEHASVLRAIAVALATSEDARRRLAVGVSKALAARAAFYDAVLDELRRAAVGRAA